MQFLRVIVSIVAAVCVATMAVITVSDMNKKNAPVIECSTEETIQVPTNATDEDLLKFVKAYDPEDGDISEHIVVERSNYFLEKGLTSVVFAVCDSDNNTYKLKKQVNFTDYHSPRIKLLNDLIIPIKTSMNFKNTVSVTDKYDGDISNKIKMVSPSYNSLVSGEYNINIKVSNSFGDDCDINVKAIVTDEDYSLATIKLSDYIIYIKTGDTPDFVSYITGVTNHGESSYRTNNITVDSSEFNSKEAGVYNIFYSINAGSQTVTKTRLVVVVEGD